MANLKNSSSWIGGASGSLDSHDGADLTAGDVDVNVTSSIVSFHFLVESAGAVESSPDVIVPDANAGNKWWDLLGARLATIQLTSGTSINEFSTDGTLAGDSDDAAPTEKATKTYVDGQIATVAAISSFGGYVDRPKFEYKDTDEIYINPGRYEHNGTSQQMVYWNSQLTFQFGAGGSNAGSSALAASDWFYLYIDDSAVVTLGTALLTEAEFVAVTTAPTWSNSKHGYYNGNDRCIGWFITNSSSQIIEFTHSGGERLSFSSAFTDRASANITTSFVTVALTGPAIDGIDMDASFNVVADADVGLGYYRAYGTTGDGIPCFDGNHQVYNIDRNINTFRVSTGLDGTDPSIDVKASSANANLAIYTSGYYFPRGM